MSRSTTSAKAFFQIENQPHSLVSVCPCVVSRARGDAALRAVVPRAWAPLAASSNTAAACDIQKRKRLGSADRETPRRRIVAIVSRVLEALAFLSLSLLVFFKYIIANLKGGRILS